MPAKARYAESGCLLCCEHDALNGLHWLKALVPEKLHSADRPNHAQRTIIGPSQLDSVAVRARHDGTCSACLQ